MKVCKIKLERWLASYDCEEEISKYIDPKNGIRTNKLVFPLGKQLFRLSQSNSCTATNFSIEQSFRRMGTFLLRCGVENKKKKQQQKKTSKPPRVLWNVQVKSNLCFFPLR